MTEGSKRVFAIDVRHDGDGWAKKDKKIRFRRDY